MKVTLLNPADFSSPEHWVAWVAKLSHGSQDKAGDDPVGFCQKLLKAGHYSVFEHATFRVHVPEDKAELLDWLYENPTIAFVWKRGGGMVLGVNLRHLLEPWEHPTRLHHFVLAAVYPKAPGLLFPTGFAVYSMLKRAELGHTPPGEDECLTGLGQPSDVQTRIDKVTYASFLIEGVSRVTETQICRHRTLSILAQSGRHVDMSKAEFVWPSDVYPETEMLASPGDPDGLDHCPARDLVKANLWHEYGVLRAKGVRKEDARFFLPQGMTTKLIATASIYHWKKFLKERLHPAAMWEIRGVAKQIKEALKL